MFISPKILDINHIDSDYLYIKDNLFVAKLLKDNVSVEDLIVEQPEDYLFSSARNYAELDNLINVELIDQKLITYN